MAQPVARPKGTVYEQAVAVLQQHTPLPVAVVLGLDGTLWPAISESCSASDVHPYDEVQGIMSALSFKSVKMAVAASSASPDTAQKALKRLGLGKLLHSQHIVSASEGKDLGTEIKDFKANFGIPLSEMLYIGSDESVTKSLGAAGLLCLQPEAQGLTLSVLEAGLARFAATKLDSTGF